MVSAIIPRCGHVTCLQGPHQSGGGVTPENVVLGLCQDITGEVIQLNISSIVLQTTDYSSQTRHPLQRLNLLEKYFPNK